MGPVISKIDKVDQQSSLRTPLKYKIEQTQHLDTLGTPLIIILDRSYKIGERLTINIEFVTTSSAGSIQWMD